MKYIKGARNSYYNDTILKKVPMVMYKFHQNQSLKVCMLINKK